MSALQDSWAGPLAKRLVDRFRSDALTYIRIEPGEYDETTGTTENTEISIPAAGAVVKSMQGERDGVQQGHKIEAWIDHVTVPYPISTSDELQYLGRRWKIIEIAPTYGSGGGDVPESEDSEAEPSPFKMYASKVIARAE